MEKIKMYVIRDAKYPQWYFQRIEDYSSMMGYLAKNHPRYTHKFTTDIKQAMHFKTPNEILEFIKEHAIEGTIVKDPYQERISKVGLNTWVRITVKLSRTSMERLKIQAKRC